MFLTLSCAPSGYTDASIGDAQPPDAQLTGDGGPLPASYVSDVLVSGDSLYRWSGTEYERMFVRGVDLGVGMPGTQPGELAPQHDDYLRWFAQMKGLGFDTVRIYTLHFPRFHEALRDYNEAHPDDPLYVIQGIWLAEESSSSALDLYGLTDDFTLLIEQTIDAAHGNVVIPERAGRAYGTYEVDISRWMLGYVVGREIHGYEVVATDAAHPSDTSYAGTQLSLASGNPSSAWAAARLDHALAYEWERYARRTPMAFANWMELDPLDHPTEPSGTGKDVASIDLVNAEPFGAPQGIFFSYHVYPYFPRFITEQPSYQVYRDALGDDSYRGYLTDLKAHHRGRALMVTEYGVPSSWGVAQLASSGMHHGGHTEDEMGVYDVRMLHDIVDLHCAGAILFHWMDGWFKRIWLFTDRTFPADRVPLWHDLMNPQESYGLVAFDPGDPAFERWPATTGTGRVREVRADADAEFFHLKITLASPLAPGERMIVGYDTYGDEVGESRLPDGRTSPRRIEFALDVGDGEVEDGSERARLMVMGSYDLYSFNGAPSTQPSQFRSTRSDAGDWRPIVYNLTAAHQSDDGQFRFPAQDWEAGRLRVRRAGGAETSQDAVVIDGEVVTIRVPWNLLQFTDPSALRVLDDDRATDGVRETAETAGIAAVIALGDDVVSTGRFRWDRWDRAPATTERLKSSADAVRAALREIPGFPDR